MIDRAAESRGGTGNARSYRRPGVGQAQRLGTEAPAPAASRPSERDVAIVGPSAVGLGGPVLAGVVVLWRGRPGKPTWPIAACLERVGPSSTGVARLHPRPGGFSRPRLETEQICHRAVIAGASASSGRVEDGAIAPGSDEDDASRVPDRSRNDCFPSKTTRGGAVHIAAADGRSVRKRERSRDRHLDEQGASGRSATRLPREPLCARAALASTALLSSTSSTGRRPLLSSSQAAVSASRSALFSLRAAYRFSLWPGGNLLVADGEGL